MRSGGLDFSLESLLVVSVFFVTVSVTHADAQLSARERVTFTVDGVIASTSVPGVSTQKKIPMFKPTINCDIQQVDEQTIGIRSHSDSVTYSFPLSEPIRLSCRVSTTPGWMPPLLSALFDLSLDAVPPEQLELEEVLLSLASGLSDTELSVFARFLGSDSDYDKMAVFFVALASDTLNITEDDLAQVVANKDQIRAWVRDYQRSRR